MFDLHPRLEQQIGFIVEIDALKQVLRQTTIIGGARRENSAEHSWHLAVMALALAEHADVAADMLRVLKMLLVHDIVEIDAGDTFCYDVQANLSKGVRGRRDARGTLRQCARPAGAAAAQLPQPGRHLARAWHHTRGGAAAYGADRGGRASAVAVRPAGDRCVLRGGLYFGRIDHIRAQNSIQG
jgi:hypothetical protein